MSQKALETLKRRGFIEWCSHPEKLEELFDREMVTAYVGFDPTADSLHVGHLIPIMGLAWLQRLGHRPICIAGGGTGMIGDPSGKSKERNLLSVEQIRKNVAGVRKQLEHFMNFDCGENSAIIVNNYDWLNSMTFLEFLRDVGKHFSVNYMVNKEHARARLNDPSKTLSYTEFSYTLLQAYDFYHLFTEMGCKLQMGGNDQQGNIVSGIDFVRKRTGEEVYGGTNPLLLNSSGTKFGKTVGGAVWLDRNRTSPYKFYQFWINSEDSAVEKLLKLFTFLSLEEIDAVMEKHNAAPERREAQKRLAFEITSVVHGEETAKTVRRASEILFGGRLEEGDLTDEMIDVLSAEAPFAKIDGQLPLPVVDVMVASGACKSKGEARRLVKGGGVYVNGTRVDEERADITGKDLLKDGHVLLRLGKKKFYMVLFQN